MLHVYLVGREQMTSFVFSVLSRLTDVHALACTAFSLSASLSAVIDKLCLTCFRPRQNRAPGLQERLKQLNWFWRVESVSLT